MRLMRLLKGRIYSRLQSPGSYVLAGKNELLIISCQSDRLFTNIRSLWMSSILCGERCLYLREESKIIKRFLLTEAAFHQIADKTLDEIQEKVEELIETKIKADDNNFPELSFASGVLTITFPPHGSWVINKQTPNKQLWWSSPISGPRRYEYDDSSKKWVCTRTHHNGNVGDEAESDKSRTLGATLVKEVRSLYGLELDLDV